VSNGPCQHSGGELRGEDEAAGHQKSTLLEEPKMVLAMVKP
jgi:hypothetical protein